jgi:hypothetical protein
MSEVALDTMTADTLAHLVGESFLLQVQPTDTFGYPVRLDKIETKPNRQRKDARVPFSLFFVGTPGMVVPQGIYRFEQKSGIVMEIFIVPVGENAEQEITYQAVFN